MWFQSKLKREQVTSSYLLASLSPGAVPMRPPILVIKITNFVRSHLTSSFGLVLLCTLISSFVAANPITTSPTWSHLHFLLCFCPALALKPALVSRHTTGSRSGVQSFQKDPVYIRSSSFRPSALYMLYIPTTLKTKDPQIRILSSANNGHCDYYLLKCYRCKLVLLSLCAFLQIPSIYRIFIQTQGVNQYSRRCSENAGINHLNGGFNCPLR